MVPIALPHDCTKFPTVNNILSNLIDKINLKYNNERSDKEFKFAKTAKEEHDDWCNFFGTSSLSVFNLLLFCSKLSKYFENCACGNILNFNIS